MLKDEFNKDFYCEGYNTSKNSIWQTLKNFWNILKEWKNK